MILGGGGKKKKVKRELGGHWSMAALRKGIYSR